MIFIGLGANLPTETHGPPRGALGHALHALDQSGVRVVKRSPWYESAPVPISDDPWYVNAVAEVATDLDPHQLLAVLLDIEASVGRVRSIANAPRVLDLDVIAHGGQVLNSAVKDGLSVTLPHVRMTERAFVMLPLRDICPDWRHPVTGDDIGTIVKNLPGGQTTRKLEDTTGYAGTEWPGPA